MTQLLMPDDAYMDEWTPLALSKADRYAEDAVCSAASRVLGGNWRMRSGVLRQRDKDGRTTEWQLDEGSWRAVEVADAGARLGVDVIYIKPGLGSGLPVEALTHG